jgi:hypothetical protein
MISPVTFHPPGDHSGDSKLSITPSTITPGIAWLQAGVAYFLTKYADRGE